MITFSPPSSAPPPFVITRRTPVLRAWGHVLAMSDSVGMFEHADLASPRLEHGYCTDDVARLLIAIMREPAPGRELRELTRVCFRFIVDAQGTSGAIRNRRSVDGRWHGRRGVEDCWGRSVWAFGTVARLAPDNWMRSGGTSSFVRALQQRSPHRRAMAMAGLGAAELLAVQPGHAEARQLLRDAIVSIGPL